MRDNIDAVKVTPEEYREARERQVAERRQIELERERQARERLTKFEAECARKAAELEKESYPLSAKEQKERFRRQELLRKQRVWMNLIAIGACTQGLGLKLQRSMKERQEQVAFDPTRHTLSPHAPTTLSPHAPATLSRHAAATRSRHAATTFTPRARRARHCRRRRWRRRRVESSLHDCYMTVTWQAEMEEAARRIIKFYRIIVT